MEGFLYYDLLLLKIIFGQLRLTQNRPECAERDFLSVGGNDDDKSSTGEFLEFYVASFL